MTVWETSSFAQPVQPIALEGEAFAVPLRFSDGIASLAPLAVKGPPFDAWVYLLDQELFVVTNNMMIYYDIGQNNLPGLKFNAKFARLLTAFGSAPTQLVIKGET